MLSSERTPLGGCCGTCCGSCWETWPLIRASRVRIASGRKLGPVIHHSVCDFLLSWVQPELGQLKTDRRWVGDRKNILNLCGVRCRKRKIVAVMHRDRPEVVRWSGGIIEFVRIDGNALERRECVHCNRRASNIQIRRNSRQRRVGARVGAAARIFLHDLCNDVCNNVWGEPVNSSFSAFL